MQNSLHVMYPRTPDDVLRDPRVSTEDFLDCEEAWAPLELLHMPLWLEWRVQVRHRNVKVPAQDQERREAIQRMSLR